MDSMINVKKLFTSNDPAPEATSDTTAQVAKHDTTDDISVDTAEKDAETTVEKEAVPAVEHETVKHQHEVREQESVERERHQHHYHTTVQPLKDREVEPEQHDHETAATQYRSVDKGDHTAGEKAGLDADGKAFESTHKDVELQEQHTTDKPLVEEQVHHHYHETVQPVIEKEVVQKSVTHKTIPVHETVVESSRDEGVSTNQAMSVEEWEASKKA